MRSCKTGGPGHGTACLPLAERETEAQGRKELQGQGCSESPSLHFGLHLRSALGVPPQSRLFIVLLIYINTGACPGLCRPDLRMALKSPGDRGMRAYPPTARETWFLTFSSAVPGHLLGCVPGEAVLAWGWTPAPYAWVCVFVWGSSPRLAFLQLPAAETVCWVLRSSVRVMQPWASQASLTTPL